MGRTAGGERLVSKRSFICRSPLLAITSHRLHYCLNHPPTPHPRLWKNCLPRNRSLVPKRLGTAALIHLSINMYLFTTYWSCIVTVTCWNKSISVYLVFFSPCNLLLPLCTQRSLVLCRVLLVNEKYICNTVLDIGTPIFEGLLKNSLEHDNKVHMLEFT